MIDLKELEELVASKSNSVALIDDETLLTLIQELRKLAEALDKYKHEPEWADHDEFFEPGAIARKALASLKKAVKL